MGEQVHALPWDERGDMRNRVEGVRDGTSMRGVYSVVWVDDGGSGYGVSIANKLH